MFQILTPVLAAILTESDGLSIGLVGLIVTTLIGCTVYITREIGSLKARISELENDRFTMSAAAEQALRTAIENPEMRVPDPRNPGRIIQVRHAITNLRPSTP